MASSLRTSPRFVAKGILIGKRDAFTLEVLGNFWGVPLVPPKMGLIGGFIWGRKQFFFFWVFNQQRTLESMLSYDAVAPSHEVLPALRRMTAATCSPLQRHPQGFPVEIDLALL